MMRKSWLLVYFALFVLFFCYLNVLHSAHAFEPWGLPADDGSAIQAYITAYTTGKDYRIPQDDNILNLDEFYVYLEWRSSEPTREFIIQIFKEMEREIIFDGVPIVEKYWQVYAEHTISILKGSNEWQDSRFGIKVIDKNVVPELKKADNTEKMVILYRNLQIEFFHLTAYGEQDETKTLQAWNFDLLIIVVWTLFLCFVSGSSSKFILNKATYVPDLPPIYLWFLIAILILAVSVVFFLISGMNLDEIMRMTMLIPAPIVAIIAAAYFAFWLASKFRPEKLRQMAFIIIDMPTLKDIREGKRNIKDEKNLITDIEVLDGYINQDGDYEFIDDPQSYLETVRRVKLGGIKIDMREFSKKIDVKQIKKNFDDIIYCERFEKGDLIVSVKDGALFSLSSVVVILGLFTFIVPLMFGFPNIVFAILGSVFLLAGIVFFIWENIVIDAPIIDIVPITDRDSLAIIRDKLTLDLKNQEIADLELELYNEKAMLAKRSREITLKAVELIEDAIMPLKELADADNLNKGLDELPDDIKKLLVNWQENWRKELSERTVQSGEK